MRIAQIIVDNREAFRDYSKAEPWFGTAPTALLQGFEELDDVEVHVVSCTQRATPALEKIGRNIWFHSLLVPKSGWLRSGYQGCVRAVRRKIAAISPDVVHAQGTERECAIAAGFCPRPRVLTIHGNLRLITKLLRPRPWSALFLQSKIEAFSIPRFDGVICISRYTQEAMEGRARRTWLLSNAVDGSFYTVKSDPITPPVLLCVATIDPRKNQNAFIDALAPLAARIPFEVHFFGVRPERGEFAAGFEERLKAHPWCRFRGMVGRAELRAEFARAAALVLPSLEDNCPMTVLEAMAAGVPVMAANVGGVPDLITNESTGLLCDPRDPVSMRRGVERLLTDRALHSHLVEGARTLAVERFLPRRIAGGHVAIYREILAESGRTSSHTSR